MIKKLILFTFMSSQIFSQSFKTHLIIGQPGDQKYDRATNCNTEGFHDTQTAVTFWGDSRIDLVDHLFYGMSSLDAYMAAAGNGWNVQNFGVIARQSQGLLDEIKECFKRETEYKTDGDITKPYFKMYPRGWRGEKRIPIARDVIIDGKIFKTIDMSLTGIYVEWKDCSYSINQKLTITFPDKSITVNAGIVRIDDNGVGIAFRGMKKEVRKMIEDLMIF